MRVGSKASFLFAFEKNKVTQRDMSIAVLKPPRRRQCFLFCNKLKRNTKHMQMY